MRLLITGASGFIGRYIVSEALRKGHKVRALIRQESNVSKMDWHQHKDVELHRADLRSNRDLTKALEGVDTVIHAAAAKSGDFYARFSGTVIATENLLAAMDEMEVNHIVLISSFAVYDFMGQKSHGQLDESSPVEPKPQRRHAYCQTKLIQENLVIDHAKAKQWRWCVLRPGAVFGHEATWTSRLGLKGSRYWIRLGARAAVPAVYVENLANAIVVCAETDSANGNIINVVDDESPSQQVYMEALLKRTSPRPMVIPIAWTMLRMTARLAWTVNQVCFRGRAKMPAILVPASLHASAKPLIYPNSRLKEVTDWRQQVSFEDAMDRSFAAESPAMVGSEKKGCS